MPIQSNLIAGFALLLGFQLGGEMIARALCMPIPGSIVGLLLLFARLKTRARGDLSPIEPAPAVAAIAKPLLRNLTILFVPAGVGAIEFADIFAAHGLTLMLVVVASTLITMAMTALAFVAAQSLAARLRSRIFAQRPWTIHSTLPSETRNR
jgi:putative effector of murein hydrolase LrgA (UPF0299 family)